MFVVFHEGFLNHKLLDLTKFYLVSDQNLLLHKNIADLQLPIQRYLMHRQALDTGPVNPRPPTTVILQATSDNKRKVNARALAGARSPASTQRVLCSACAQPTALGYKRCINNNVSQLN
jgi:hypothetical protein